MFKPVKRLVGQMRQDVKVVERGETDEALKRRLRPAAQQTRPVVRPARSSSASSSARRQRPDPYRARRTLEE